MSTTRQLSPEHVALGKAVRELRTRRSRTQAEVAERAGMHAGYVGAIERGEANPSFRRLVLLARAIDVPLSVVVRLCERSRFEMEHPA